MLIMLSSMLVMRLLEGNIVFECFSLLLRTVGREREVTCRCVNLHDTDADCQLQTHTYIMQVLNFKQPYSAHSIMRVPGFVQCTGSGETHFKGKTSSHHLKIHYMSDAQVVAQGTYH